MTDYIAKTSLQLISADLKNLVLRNRDDIYAYINLGIALRWQQKFRQAFELHYNLLVHPKLRGDLIYRLNLELGYDLFELRKKDLGLSYFEKASRSKVYRTYALEGIALVHAASGKPENAISQLEELAKTKQVESFDNVFTSAAKNLRIRGETGRAKKLLEKLSASKKSSAGQALEMIYLHQQEKQFAIIPQLVRKGLNDHPQNAKAYLLCLEDAYFQMNTYHEYEDALRLLLLDFPNQADLYFSLAKHLAKKKKNKEALSCIEK